MKRGIFILALCAGWAQAHDIITTPLTFDREIVRLLNARCNSCHREGGSAFSLMTYNDARPWAEAIKEEVLSRRMPPWGAIKGFGDFRNDQALTPEQVELIEGWADGGAPEGDPKDLPPAPKFSDPLNTELPHGAIAVSGELRVKHAFMLGGLVPRTIPGDVSLQITAELPDGSIEPLLWLEEYKPKFAHPFWLRTPLELPAGTMIHGVPAGARIDLLPPGAEPPAPENAARPASAAAKAKP